MVSDGVCTWNEYILIEIKYSVHISERKQSRSNGDLMREREIERMRELIVRHNLTTPERANDLAKEIVTWYIEHKRPMRKKDFDAILQPYKRA